MPGSKLKIIAGLGNPGKDYARTRHNIGFLAVDALARKYNLSCDKSRFDAEYAKVRISGIDIFLLKPSSYMNRSGIPIQRFASYYKIPPDDIIVIHDDMDLAAGQLKIVKNRGHGGHNGVRSIIDAFGGKSFARVRIGVGRPDPEKQVTGHVLGKFAPSEQAAVEECVDLAVDACLKILSDGVNSAMNQYNSKK